MSGRPSAATEHGLRLIAKGMTLRAAAEKAGVAASTLVRARQRLNLEPLPAGRPARKAPPTK